MMNSMSHAGTHADLAAAVGLPIGAHWLEANIPKDR